MGSPKETSILTSDASANINIQDRKQAEEEMIADLDALFWMTEYIELELERISSECVLSAGTLRAVIASEITARKTVFAMQHARN
jgi:hypothetical protein